MTPPSPLLAFPRPLLLVFLLLMGCGGGDPAAGGSGDSDPSAPQASPLPPEAALTSDLAGSAPETVEVIEKARAAVRATPTDGRRWGELGMAFQVNLLPQESLACYRYAALLQPAEALWPHLEAIALADGGDLAGAIAAMRKSIALDGSFAPAHRRLGGWLLETGDLDAAQAAFERALEEKPGDSGSRVGLARIQLQRDEVDAAIFTLEQVAQFRPQDAYVSGVLIRAYRQGGHALQATRLAQGVTSDEPSWWDARWEEALDFQAQTFAVRRSKARALYASARYEEAIAALETLRAEDPEDTSVLNTMVLCYERLDRPEDAIRVARECLAVDPDNRDALVNGGGLIGRQGDAEGGLALLAHALELDPEDAGAHFARGSVLHKSGDVEGALAAYRRSIEIDARNVGTWLVIGRLEGKLKHWDRGLEAFKEAESAGLQRGDTYLGIAKCAMEMGELKEAWDALATAVDYPPTDRQRFNNLRTELQRRTAIRQAEKQGKDAGGANAGEEGEGEDTGNR